MLLLVINRQKIADELSVLLVWSAEFVGCSLERPGKGSRPWEGAEQGDKPVGSPGRKVCSTWKGSRTPCCVLCTTALA